MRSLWGLLFIVLEPEQLHQSDVTLMVRDFTGMPAAALEIARQEVVGIFSRAGLNVGWTVVSEGSTARSAMCDRTYRIHIVPKSFFLLNNKVMGLADKKAALGPVAYVFHDRVEELVKEYTQEPQIRPRIARMLGHAIAHEVGHLLLPTANDHTPSGIMKAKWELSDLVRADHAGFGFNDREASAIRQSLATSAVRP